MSQTLYEYFITHSKTGHRAFEIVGGAYELTDDEESALLQIDKEYDQVLVVGAVDDEYISATTVDSSTQALFNSPQSLLGGDDKDSTSTENIVSDDTAINIYSFLE